MSELAFDYSSMENSAAIDKFLDIANKVPSKATDQYRLLLEKKLRNQAALAMKAKNIGSIPPLTQEEESDLKTLEYNEGLSSTVIESAVRNQDAWFDGDDPLSQAGNLITGVAAGAGAQIGANIVKAPFAAAKSIATLDLGGEKLDQIREIETKLKNQVTLSQEIKRLEKEKAGGNKTANLALNKAIKELEANKLTPAQTLFKKELSPKDASLAESILANERRIAAIEEAKVSINSVVDTFSKDIAGYKLKDANETALEEIKAGNWGSGLYTYFSAALDMVINNPNAALQYTADSLPYTLSFMFFPEFAIPISALDINDTAVNEFRKEYGHTPNRRQQAISVAVSTLSAALDAVGAKVIKGGKGGIIKFADIIKKTGVKVPANLMTKLGASLARVTGVAADAILVEGGTEYGQEILEQYAAKQDISKIEQVPAMTAGQIGMTSGGIMAAPSAGVRTTSTLKKAKDFTDTTEVRNLTKNFGITDTGSAYSGIKPDPEDLKESITVVNNKESSPEEATAAVITIISSIVTAPTKRAPKQASTVLAYLEKNPEIKIEEETVSFLREVANTGVSATKSAINKAGKAVGKSIKPVGNFFESSEERIKRGEETGDKEVTIKGYQEVLNTNLSSKDRVINLKHLSNAIEDFQEQVNNETSAAKKEVLQQSLEEYNLDLLRRTQVFLKDRSSEKTTEITTTVDTILGSDPGTVDPEIINSVVETVKSGFDAKPEDIKKLLDSGHIPEGSDNSKVLDQYVKALTAKDVNVQVEEGQGKGKFRRGTKQYKAEFKAALQIGSERKAAAIINSLARWHDWHSQKAPRKLIWAENIIKLNAEESAAMKLILDQMQDTYKNAFDKKPVIDKSRFIKFDPNKNIPKNKDKKEANKRISEVHKEETKGKARVNDKVASKVPSIPENDLNKTETSDKEQKTESEPEKGKIPEKSIKKKKGIPDFTLVKDIPSKTSPNILATIRQGAILVKDVSVKEFFEYFLGEGDSTSSTQKKLVLERLAELGYPEKAIRKLLNSPKRIREFLALHEHSHAKYKDRKVYWKFSRDLLTADKIQIEVRATIEALQTLNKLYPKDAIPELNPRTDYEIELDQIISDLEIARDSKIFVGKSLARIESLLGLAEKIKDKNIEKTIKEELAWILQLKDEIAKINAIVEKRTGDQLKNSILINPVPITQNEKYDPIIRKSIPKSLSRIVRAKKGTPGNIFQKVPNLFINLEDKLKKLLGNKYNAITKGNQVILNTLQKTFEFYDELINGKDSILWGMNQKKGTPFETDIFNPDTNNWDVTYYLLQGGWDPSKRNVNKNLVALISSITLEWLGTRGSSTLINDEDAIRAILHLNERDEIPPGAYNALHHIGIPRTAIEEAIGNKIYKMMELEGFEPKFGHIIPKLKLALGQIAVTGLLKGELVVENKYALDELLETNEDIDPDAEELLINEDDPKYKHTKFIRILSKNKTDPDTGIITPIAIDAINTIESHMANGGSTFIKEIFDIESSIREPLFEAPADKHNRKVKNSTQDVTAETNKNINQEEKDPWVTTTYSNKIYKLLDKKFKLIIGGWADPIGKHDDEVASINDKNALLEKNIDLFDIFNSNLEGNPEQEIFFEYEQYSSGRIGITSNTINPLFSKEHRGLISKKAWFKDLDLSNEKHKFAFQLGIAQALGISTETDRETVLEELSKAFTDPVLIAAVKSVQQIDKGNINEEYQQAIADATLKYKEKFHTYKGIVELSRAVNTVEPGDLHLTLTKNKINTDIIGEIDGKTNGPAFSIMQSAIDFDGNFTDHIRYLLSSCGILTGIENTFYEWKSKTGNLDIYQRVAKTLIDTIYATPTKFITKRRPAENTETLMNALSTFINDFKDDEGNISKDGREFVKKPVVSKFFGAGNNSLKLAAYNKILAEIKSQVATLHIGSPTYTEVRHTEINNALSVIFKANVKINRNNAKQFQIEHIYPLAPVVLKKVTDATYGGALAKSMSTLFAGADAYKGAIDDATAMMYQYFNLVYQAAVEDRVKYNASQEGGYTRDLSDEERFDILDQLKEILPAFKGYYSKEISDSISVLNSTKIKNYNKDRQQQRYKVPITGTEVAKDNKHGSKSTTSTTSAIVFTDPGGKGALFDIHNKDVVVQQEVWKIFNILNIHDATVGSVLDMDARGLHHNQTFHKLNKEHHGLSAIQERLLEMEEWMYSNGWGSEISKLEKELLNDNQFLIHHGLNLLLEEGVKDLQTDFKVFDYLKENINSIKQASVAAREQLYKEIHTVDQYIVIGGAYKLISEPESSTAWQDKVSPEMDSLQDEILDSARPKILTSEEEAKLRGRKSYTEYLSDLKEATKKILTDPKSSTKEKLDAVSKLKNRADIWFEEVSTIDPNISKKTEENTVPTDQDFRREAEEDTFGSDGNFDTSKFKNPVYEQDINPLNSQEIFNDMDSFGVKKESTQHQSRLQSVLTGIINNIIKPSHDLKIKLKETTDVGNRGVIKNAKEIFVNVGLNKSKLVNNYNKSAQEIYVHELVHAIATTGLDNNFAIKRQVQKLFNQAAESLTPEDFLETTPLTGDSVLDAKIAKSDMELAEATYEYIFNNNDGTSLYEFVAYGLTNERCINALSKLVVKRNNKKAGNVYEFLANAWNSLLDFLFNKFYKTHGKSLDQALYSLIQQLDSSKDERVGWLKSKLGEKDLDTHLTNRFNKYIFNPIEKLYEKYAIERGSKIAATLGLPISIYRLMQTEEFAIAIQKARRRIGLTEQNFLVKLVREIAIGQNENNGNWHALLRKAKKMIDQARKHEATVTETYIKDNILSDMTSEERSIMHRMICNTDLQTIIDKYSQHELIKFLTDPDALMAEINKYENDIKKGKKASLGKYYTNQANGLGYFLATGQVAVRELNLNAYNIAMMFGTSKPNTEIDTVLQGKIDELATLYAINYSSMLDRRQFADLVKTEFDINSKKNGISVSAHMHRALQKQSEEELFKGSKALMRKGYTSVITNPHIHILIAPGSQEAELKKEGYEKAHNEPLKKDKSLPMEGDMFLYVTRESSPNPRIRASASITSKHSAGTSISDIYRQSENSISDKQLEFEIESVWNANKKAMMADTSNAGDLSKAPKHFLLPIRNPDGKSVNYRYPATEFTKRTVMEMDERIEKTLGITSGSIIDRVNTEVINKEVVDLAKQDYDQMYGTGKSDFVSISPLSPDGKNFQETYKLLPKEMRDYIREVWGDDEMLVRAELADMIFGYRKASLINLTLFNKEVGKAVNDAILKVNDILFKFFPKIHYKGALPLKAFEQKIQDAVTVVKDLIVVKSVGVMVQNLISNYFLLAIKGVPLTQIVKLQKEAYSAIDSYHKDLMKKDLLQRELISEVLTPTKKRNLENKIANLDKQIKTNPAHALVYEGLFQSIIEDVEIDTSIYNTGSKLATYAEEWSDKYLPKAGQSLAKQLWMSRDTSTYKFLSKMTQYGDFISRYALYQHRMNQADIKKLKKGSSEYKKKYDDIITEVVETFINYDVPTSPEMQWLNDMGIFMFTKFLFRIQRIIFKTFKERPASTLTLLALRSALGLDLSSIHDSGLWNGLGARLNTPFGTAAQALTVPMANVSWH